jgi:hypothetical protein
MTQTILNVVYEFQEKVYENLFILFEGDTINNLLPINAKIISVQVIK